MNKLIVDNLTMKRTIRRLSYEIIEKHPKMDELVLIGIKSKGVRLAQIIRDNIQAIEGENLAFFALDISAHRDDKKIPDQPDLNTELKQININNKVVILIDDVLYTGRTIRAAMDTLIDFGRPQAIELVVLVDRGHRQLPIKANYIGKNIPTSKEERIQVTLSDFSESDHISITRT